MRDAFSSTERGHMFLPGLNIKEGTLRRKAWESQCLVLKISPQQRVGESVVMEALGFFFFLIKKQEDREQWAARPELWKVRLRLAAWQQLRVGAPRGASPPFLPTALSALRLRISNLLRLVSRELLEAKPPITG